MRDYRRDDYHDYYDGPDDSFYYEDLGDGLEGGPPEFDWDEMDEEDWEHYFDPGLDVTDPDPEGEF